MDKARAAVSDFLSKDGKHDTTVHERVNPAITNENVTRTQHEDIQPAIDREVHQDHHHTSIQPIQHKEVMPEVHSHNIAGVEHRNLKHGNDDHVKQRLANEKAQFKNTRSVGDIQHSTTTNPAVAGEHVHHHVHENIQPVVQKETVQPSVVHTTVPIHEVHQNEAKHHTASQLPAVSMDDFKRHGGHLSGREERTDAFSGEPKNVGGTLGGSSARGTTSLTGADEAARGFRNGNQLGTTSSAGGVEGTGHNAGYYNNNTTGYNGNATSTGKKPGMMDKLNPTKDADRDGKTGVMD